MVERQQAARSSIPYACCPITFAFGIRFTCRGGARELATVIPSRGQYVMSPSILIRI